MGDRIRITAQLVDAQSGIRQWGERFDRALGDIFAIQDEITQSIVRIVVAHVGNAEVERVARKTPDSWTAPAAPDLGSPKDLEKGYELALKAVSLDPNLPLARAQLGWAYFWMKQIDGCVGEFEKAVSLNPNFTDYRFSATLVFAGEPARALEVLQAHVRVDPFHPPQLRPIQGHAVLYAQTLSRPYWRGYLRLSLVTCPVVLYSAATQAERTHFHMINKETGNRLHQQMVDEETGEVVDKENKGRGYELSKGKYVEIEPEELEAIQLESTRTVDIDTFVPSEEIDKRYYDHAYYIAPDGKTGIEAFADPIRSPRRHPPRTCAAAFCTGDY